MIFSFKNFENLMKKYHILSIMLAWKKVNHIWSIDGYSGIKLLFFLWNHQKSRFALLTKKSVRFQAFESLLPFTYQLLFLNLSKIWSILMRDLPIKKCHLTNADETISILYDRNVFLIFGKINGTRLINPMMVKRT